MPIMSWYKSDHVQSSVRLTTDWLVVGYRTLKDRCECMSRSFIGAFAAEEGCGPVRQGRIQQDGAEPLVFVCNQMGEDRDQVTEMNDPKIGSCQPTAHMF